MLSPPRRLYLARQRDAGVEQCTSGLKAYKEDRVTIVYDTAVEQHSWSLTQSQRYPVKAARNSNQSL